MNPASQITDAVTQVDAAGLALASSWSETQAINLLAGHAHDAGWQAVDHQMKIVTEEWNEMVEGIDTRDIKEFRDGLGDLLFTLCGLAWRAGVPAVRDLRAVVNSNWTKYDTSQEDAEKTAEKYKALGLETYYREASLPYNPNDVYWVTYSATDQVDINGKKYFAGKWLKSYRFELPKFEPLPDHNRLRAETESAHAPD